MPTKQDRAQRELDLLLKAKQGDGRAKGDLLKLLEPVMQPQINKFRGGPLGDSLVTGKAYKLALQAIEDYDPSAGTQLNTWVTWKLRGLAGEVNKVKDLTRVASTRRPQMAEFQKTVSRLKGELGHDPDARTVADAMNMSLEEAGRLRKETQWSPRSVDKMFLEMGRSEMIGSADEAAEAMYDAENDARREVLRYIYHDLGTTERAVFEYMYGLYGKPKLSGNGIAAQLGFSAPKVSRIKKQIEAKIDERMQRRGFHG